MIRKAKKSDIKDISSIFIEVSLTDINKIGKNALKNYLSYVIKSKKYIVLVAEELKVLGFCITQLGVPMPDSADLIDIDVGKKVHGKGIGQKLMAELYKRLKQKQIKNLGLYSENVTKTINFYEKQGFKRGRTVIRFDKKL
ncbi:MAG: GNAT family N-acetyltransferase [Candidatus Woesearchaeota archaeon]|nr:GNAT family N-acetyltransferase [Candidatus Woesearchaeota archaeon]